MDKRKVSAEIEDFLASMRKQSLSIIEAQTPEPETDPEYEIKNYPRLLQLARAGLVPDDLVSKMSYVLKDPKRFGVSPKIRDQLYDLMIKTLNYIVVSDPAAWARFRAFLVNEEFKEILKDEVSKINPTKQVVIIRDEINEKKELVKKSKQRKIKSSLNNEKPAVDNLITEIKSNDTIVSLVEEKNEVKQEPIVEEKSSLKEITPSKNKTIEIDYPTNNSNSDKLYQEVSNTVEQVLKKELAKYSMYA